MEIDISWEESGIDPAEQAALQEILRQAVAEVLLLEGSRQDAEIGLLLTNNKAIRELNKTYREIDSPTDVLSFALQEKGRDEPEIFWDDLSDGEDNALGDIVISVERAREQAGDYGHSFRRELVYLAVHGTLHLLGYDHETQQEKKKMREMEEQVLKRLDLPR